MEVLAHTPDWFGPAGPGQSPSTSFGIKDSILSVHGTILEHTQLFFAEQTQLPPSKPSRAGRMRSNMIHDC